jgi:hypothetical protein
MKDLLMGYPHAYSFVEPVLEVRVKSGPHWFPSTRRFCSFCREPTSAGKEFSLLSERIRSARLAHFPMLVGKPSRALAAKFSFCRLDIHPIDSGRLVR